jgi:chromosomal replication initiation ATPase DnaA
MLSLLLETWERIQSDLQQEVGAAAHEAWLRDLRPIALERSVCHFEAKNRMVAEHVRRLHAPRIEALLSAAFGTKVGLQISSPPEGIVPDRLEVGPTLPIVGPFNESAFRYLRGLLQGRELPGRLFVFHGPRECGKSFLLNWWTDLWRRTHGVAPLTLTGEHLLRVYQASLRDGRTADLRAEFAVDRPLILDEIHRVSGHERIQYEIEQLLRARERFSSPTLCASRHLPRDIWRLAPGLQSYLSSGHLAGIEPPGLESRLRYLRALVGAAARNGRANAIEEIARDVRGSFVELRRAWQAVRKGLPHHAGTFRFVDPGAVFRRQIERIAKRLGLVEAEIVGGGQGRKASLARQWLAFECLREGMSQAEIGRHMDGRSRAAIHYAIRTFERRCSEDPEIRKLTEEDE